MYLLVLSMLFNVLFIVGCNSGTAYHDWSADDSVPAELASSSDVRPRLKDGDSSRDKKDSETDNRPTQKIDFSKPPNIGELARGEVKPVPKEELETEFKNAGKDWFFGHGLGSTLLNVGGIVIFPPYALYLLGNAGLQLFGYSPLYVTDALPEPVHEPVMSVVDGVTGAPGRFNAIIFDEEFREK